MVKNKNLKRKPSPLLNNKKGPTLKQIVDEPDSSDEEVNKGVTVMCLNGFFIENIFRIWF